MVANPKLGGTQMVLQGKRIIIRPYEREDEKAVYKIINCEGIYHTTLNIPYPYPKDQVAVWLHFTLKNSAYKKGYEWGIFTYDGTYIGNVGIVNVDYINNSGEITYFIGEPYWKKGFATEAVKLMLGYGFEVLGLERIQGRCMVRNPASLKVMQKCGFTYEGLARHEVIKEGKYEDVWRSAIIKEDYLKFCGE